MSAALLDSGFFLIVVIVELSDSGIMFPLNRLILSCVLRINLDLLTKVCNLFAFFEHLDEVAHRGEGRISIGDVNDLTLAFLNSSELLDYLEFVANDRFKMCNNLGSEQVRVVSIVLFGDWNSRKSNGEVLQPEFTLLHVID